MHTPVLLNEVLRVLDPNPGEFFIDGTINGGGHAKAILEKIGHEGMLLGVDWNSTVIEKLDLGKNTIVVNDNFKNIPMIVEEKKTGKADGLLLDFGFSSLQLTGASGGRGFSFQKDEPLLMTYSDTMKPAYLWIRELREAQLAGIIKEFGEERFADKIAKAIKKDLPKTSKELSDLVREAVPKNYEHGRIHPATRTFQALRIFVNQELENIKEVLDSLLSFLNPGARVAIISFHSLEDRMVKNAFRDFAKNNRVALLTKKPIVAGDAEVQKNPRSRSAKLRAVKVI